MGAGAQKGFEEFVRSRGERAFQFAYRLCGSSDPLTGRARAHDVYAAAQYLKAQPDVDAARIGAIGWSHGGWTALWALMVAWKAKLSSAWAALPSHFIG